MTKASLLKVSCYFLSDTYLYHKSEFEELKTKGVCIDFIYEHIEIPFFIDKELKVRNPFYEESFDKDGDDAVFIIIDNIVYNTFLDNGYFYLYVDEENNPEKGYFHSDHILYDFDSLIDELKREFDVDGGKAKVDVFNYKISERLIELGFSVNQPSFEQFVKRTKRQGLL